MVNGWLAQKCNGTAPQNGKTQRQTMLQNPLQDQAKHSNSDLTGAGILLIFLFILLFLFPYWMLLEPFPLINYSLRNPCLRLCFGEAMRDKSQITQHLDDASQHERDWEALAWRAFCLFIMVHIYILLKKKKSSSASGVKSIATREGPFVMFLREAAEPCLTHLYISLLWNYWKERKSKQASAKTSFPTLIWVFKKNTQAQLLQEKSDELWRNLLRGGERGINCEARPGNRPRRPDSCNSLLGNLLSHIPNEGEGRLQFCLQNPRREEKPARCTTWLCRITAAPGKQEGINTSKW